MNGFLTNNFSCNIYVCSLDKTVSEIRILFLKTVKAGFSNIAGSLQICVEFQARKTCIVKINFDKSKENDFFPKVFLIMLNTELYKMLPLHQTWHP